MSDAIPLLLVYLGVEIRIKRIYKRDICDII